MKFPYLQSSIALLLVGSSPAAEPLPLSTSYWKSDAFVDSFNGSYRIEARIEPVVSTEERGLLVEVQKLMKDGNRESALAKVKGSKLTSGSAALQFNLGNLYFEEGKMEEAGEAYEAALKKYPSFRRAHRNLALVLVREGEMDEGLEHLLEALRLGDSDGTTYGLLGFCRLQKGEWASALQAYRMAQLGQPDSNEWKAGVAQCLQHLDAQAEAVALLDEVIRRRPSEASYASLQASILMDLGELEQAVKALELPRRLGTLNPDSLMLLAELHLRAGRAQDAEGVMNEAFAGELAPSDGRVVALLQSAITMEVWDLAKVVVAKVDEASDEEKVPSRPLRRARARLDIASGEAPERGVETLGKLIAEDPTDGAALLALADYRFSNESLAEAELLFERASAVEESAADAWVGLARVRVEQRRYEDALKATEQALQLRPGGELQVYRDSLAQLFEASR